MSLQLLPIPAIPPMTIEVARRAFRQGNVYMQMRDILGTLFVNDQFADLYPADGQPAYAPWRLALISVMQFAENLTDRQAADAVRSRIDWKYALSLELTDEGFDFSVLSEFRSRLLDHDAGQRLLDIMLEQFRQAGLLQGGGQQRTDSTYVLASVRALGRLELVGRTLQAALDAVADTAPEWLRDWAAPEWYTRYGKLLTEFRLPQRKSERETLAIQIGWDGLCLLEAIYTHPTLATRLSQLEPVEIMRQIWVQQYVLKEEQLYWRTREEMPPAARLIQSPFDLDAHYSRKQTTEWVGYKVHFTETCSADTPHVIIHVLTTNAAQHDINALQPIHQHLQKQRLLPAQHLVDSGYTSARELVDCHDIYGVELVGPLPERPAWQHTTGYEIESFTIDWANRQVICPQGNISPQWGLRTLGRGEKLTRVKFRRGDCKPCPVRQLCTKHVQRTLSFHEQPLQEAMQHRQQEQQTVLFQQRYAKRSGVEGTISQGVFSLGMRRSRYRGQAKTHLQFILTAAAINLTRILNWHNAMSPSQSPITHFGRLAA